jgi:hypothetical protein
MNRIITVSLIIVAFVISAFFSDVSGKVKKSSLMTYKGRVINYTGEYIELKSGSKEVVLYYSDDTKYASSDGSLKDKNIIEICQMARAQYVSRGGKKILVKIQVLTESYCK